MAKKKVVKKSKIAKKKIVKKSKTAKKKVAKKPVNTQFPKDLKTFYPDMPEEGYVVKK
jgi:hypothetical protein